MKNHLALLTALFITLLCFSQQKNNVLHLRSGAVTPPSNFNTTSLDSINRKLARQDKTFLIIQFNKIPDAFTRQQLSVQGIELLNYIPDNAYTASVTGVLNINHLLQSGIRAIYQPLPQQKMDASLVNGIPPAYAVKIPGTVDVWISFLKSYSAEEVIASLNEMGIEVLSSSLKNYQVLNLRIALNRVFQLAEQPFVEYVLPALPPDQPLNANSRSLSHANVLNASVADGGKGLNGEGIVIGIGDNADIQSHIDFSGRLINRSAGPVDFHGIHTSGTMAGAGILNETYRGYLPKATIISQWFNGILTNASTYVADYNMVITNNSYGAIIGCATNGIYDMASIILDRQALDMPYLQHVFAAGNSGNSTCDPYPKGFRTVLGAYQSAKNIICVGNSDAAGNLANPSSRGPVRDGRLKPDITALGTIVSTWPGNTYNPSGGTSMSAPAVAGGLGLLYQRYRQLHSTEPKSGLMKALMLNGAYDRGNAGPDFQNGFGSMNLLRSIDMLDNNRFFTDNIANASSVTHSISVPANTAKLKLMLYWHDPAASILAEKALVNDLDLELVNSSSITKLPLILDSTLPHVNDVAINGSDHINNTEQIVIDDPASGNYSIRVKATAINQNPAQEYFVVYDLIPNSIQLTYPVGGEGLVPGEFVNIAWDSYGDDGSSFTLQYSIDGGANWNDLSATIAAGTQFFSWQVSSVASDKAQVRIVKNATSQTSISNQFSIIGLPAVSLSALQCEGYLAIEWAPVANATAYNVMMLKGAEMITVATTTATAYNFTNLSKDSVYWVGVRAGINGKWGRRSGAIARQPNSGNCSGSISDNDLKLNAILSPVTGRKFTSTELTSATTVKVEVKNLDDATVNNFTLKYSIDGGNSWVAENVAASLAPAGIYTHNFTTTANLSATTSYPVIAVVINSITDTNTGNDTLKTIVKHLTNQPLNLAGFFKDDFETTTEKIYESKTTGLTGGDRYDFENTTTLGRLRNFINSGIAYSGKKALTMDIKSQSPGANVNYLTATFNLSNYDANAKELRLDFRYSFHGGNAEENNKLWIRGRDSDAWILMYDLFVNKAEKGVYKLTSSIELSDSLLKHGQNFSGSFQVRWSQNGFFPAVEKASAGGTSIDDIRLYEVINDAELVKIDAPVGHSCDLTNAVPIKITIRNGTKTPLTQVPVKYSINGGSWVTELVASIAGETTVQYTFTKLADLSQPGAYTIKAVVDHSNDNFRENDTIVAIVQSMPLVTSFPYLQNFENSDGGWFARGERSSWAYGTPSSPKINRAASGSKAWKTNLSGNYNDRELSYLYSPCFQIGGLSNPTLSFSAAFDLEDCGTTACDGLTILYSEDGVTWQQLIDTAHTAVNWYNKADAYWSVENYTRWHVVTIQLPRGLNTVRFRFWLSSDPAVTREGAAIDDIHVYDNTKGIYTGNTLTTPITQTISGGNNWVNFEKDGKLIASVQPNNQNLGTTDVQAYVHTGSVRNTGTQYYHNRSITIKPAQSSLTDSASVRFYFLDSETDSLINASGCTGCTKPSSAYELGVSQYHDYDTSFENGNINDNLQGLWNYINFEKSVKVPFDKGYYAEFKVKDFSEFWLNNGTPDRSTPLPVKLFNFSLQKTGVEDVMVSWTVGSENNVVRYEIEVARNEDELQSNKFEKIGEVPGSGNSAAQRQYSYIDKEALKYGTRYYRIKTVNLDGSFTYSLVRSIQFNNIASGRILPNPSKGVFYFINQANIGEMVKMQITDAIGKQIKTYGIPGNGFVQKFALDISGNGYAPGIYILRVQIAGSLQSFKLYKQ